MNNVRKRRKDVSLDKLTVDIDKNVIKAIILESYNEIEEQKRSKHTPTEFLKLPLSLIFGALQIVLGFFALGFFVTPFLTLYNKGVDFANIAAGILSIVIAILCGLFSLICHKTGKEVDKETDKYYIVAYFSAIVSLVALIVALIGLIKVI